MKEKSYAQILNALSIWDNFSKSSALWDYNGSKHLCIDLNFQYLAWEFWHPVVQNSNYWKWVNIFFPVKRCYSKNPRGISKGQSSFEISRCVKVCCSSILSTMKYEQQPDCWFLPTLMTQNYQCNCTKICFWESEEE